jgi:hypothetical protein
MVIDTGFVTIYQPLLAVQGIELGGIYSSTRRSATNRENTYICSNNNSSASNTHVNVAAFTSITDGHTSSTMDEKFRSLHWTSLRTTLTRPALMRTSDTRIYYILLRF